MRFLPGNQPNSNDIIINSNRIRMLLIFSISLLFIRSHVRLLDTINEVIDFWSLRPTNLAKPTKMLNMFIAT